MYPADCIAICSVMQSERKENTMSPIVTVIVVSAVLILPFVYCVITEMLEKRRAKRDDS
jgi:hypothetical protein